MKKYNGKTAGGYLKTAKIYKMKAGNYEIISDDAPDCMIYRTEYGTMVMRDSSGIVCDLVMSNHAHDKLISMEKEMEAKY